MRTSLASLASLVALAFSLAACPTTPADHDALPGDASTDAAADAPFDATPAGPPGITARFNPPSDGGLPAPFEVPFPTDLYRDTDGTLIDTIDQFNAIHLVRNTSLIAQGFRDLDGFGLTTGAMFLIDGTPAHIGDALPDVDPASLPATGAASIVAGASAFIVDLDPALALADARVPCAAGWHGHFRTITVQPDRTTLAPGHRYAVVLTTAIHSSASAGGFALSASAPFAAVRDSMPGARTSALGMLYGDAIDRVVSLMGAGFDRTTIAALAVFTTQNNQHQLRAARDAVVAGRFGAAAVLHTDSTSVAPFSAVRFGSTAHAGWTATLDAWLGTPLRHTGQDVPGFPASTEAGVGLAHDALGAVFSATFAAADFRGTNGRFTVGTDGVPTPATTDRRIPLTVALPRGPVPATGFPVVIYAHGLGGQRADMLGLMNELARAGFATVSIDWPTFGQRATPMPADTQSAGAGPYNGPDGFADTTNGNPADFVGNFQDMAVFRDNLRESALEIVQLRRALADPALDLSVVAAEYGGTAPRLDGQHVAYAGGSLGGIIGTLVAGVEPLINPFVLNVAGAEFAMQVVTTAPNEGSVVQALLGTVLGIPSNEVLDRYHPVANLLQMVLDAGDPAVYAHDVTHPATGRGHDVWLIEALWDETVGNASTDLLASLLGVPQLTPAALRVDALPTLAAPASGNLPGGATGGFFQLAPAAHYTNLLARESGQLRYAPPFPRDGTQRFVLLAHPYTVREWVVPLQRNVASFIASTFAGTSRIDVTGLEPILDLDDDGWTDVEETTASTDPFDPTSHPAGTPPHTRDVGY